MKGRKKKTITIVSETYGPEKEIQQELVFKGEGKIHAKFGSPSGLYALTKCPGKIAYGRDIPEPPTSKYALEGTVFHDVMEKYLPHFLTTDFSTCTPMSGLSISIDMSNDCKEYPGMYEIVLESAMKARDLWDKFSKKRTDCHFYVELKVKCGNDLFGTSDLVFAGIDPKTRKVDVVALDWKFGTGVRVNANENLQGIAYLLGTLETLNIKPQEVGKLAVIIAQVRLDDGWSTYALTQEELFDYRAVIFETIQRAKAIYSGDLPIEGNLSAGTHCRFCKCLPVCVEAKKSSLEKIEEGLTELPVHFIHTLTLEEQAQIFAKKSQVEDFLDAVAKNLMCIAEAGIEVPGHKLVETKGRRKFPDDESVVGHVLEKMGVNPWVRKLRGITELEKELGKGALDPLTVLTGGKLQLVPASDKRPAVKHINTLQELDLPLDN